MTKTKMLFWLNRRLKELEVDPPDHAKMATMGMSYEARQEMLKHIGEQRDRHAGERDALKAAIEFLQTNYPNDE